jgi:hypothetical protein
VANEASGSAKWREKREMAKMKAAKLSAWRRNGGESLWRGERRRISEMK